MPWITYQELFERNQRLMEEQIKKKIEMDTPAYKEEQERRARDTKPLFYHNESVPGRPVIAVGAGTRWFNDLKELTQRTLEKPDPRFNPQNVRDIKTDVVTAIDKLYRERKGTSVFHIRNNPLAH